jgi:predicted esterase
MIKPKISAVIFIFTSLVSYSQPAKPVRYKDPIFSKVNIEKNLTYFPERPSTTKDRDYRFDFYQAAEDSSLSRPMIIWMHGGGFKFGSKRAKGIKLWSKSFAKRGYVCAGINYRLSKKNPLRNFKALMKGCYEARQDVIEAVKYFKNNHSKYRIDTNRIIVAGNSAGAIVALQAVYATDSALLALLGEKDLNLDATVDSPARIAGIINFWGAIFNTEWLKNSNVPIVSVHGERDKIIPYKRKDSPMFGSYFIHQKADSLQIPNHLKTYPKYGHELQKHFIPILRSSATKRRWLDAGKVAADFLYGKLLH